MCGIAGIVSRAAVDERLVARMTACLGHRGPDDGGQWVDGAAQVALGHRRLAIIDLSPSGHQPMVSQGGRWVISYNGEIYNHAELHRELDAQTGGSIGWRGHSDSEVLVEAVARWGLAQALAKCVGMFAVAAWDRAERKLYLARDRFGEKPLYYGWVGQDLLFASELKAFRLHPQWRPEVDRCALGLYAERSYVPAPLSIYRFVYKVEPGAIVTVDASNGPPTRQKTPPNVGEPAHAGVGAAAFWSYASVVRDGLAQPFLSEGEALGQLEDVLEKAVRAHMTADVPVGAFLSGGIDSSLIVALYQKSSSVGVRTFTIGFDDPRFDESDHAGAVAAHLGTVHQTHRVTVAEAQGVIPMLPSMFDEPFGDSSAVPTFLVSKLARTDVKVALSGDGGDELFGGYNRYVHLARVWSRLKHVPRPARIGIAALVGRLPATILDGMAMLATGGRSPDAGMKVSKALRAMAGEDLDHFARSFLDEWGAMESPVRAGGRVAPERDSSVVLGGAPDAVRLMLDDARSFLPDDVLCKVDRSSMAVSLETRAPFLDHRVAEVASRIPIRMNINAGQGKLMLRKLLYRHVPPRLLERPKTGFSIPVGEWIKGPLRPWAQSLLASERIAAEGYFDPDSVDRRWRDHLTGRRDSTSAIWSILMFQSWLDQQHAPPTEARNP